MLPYNCARKLLDVRYNKMYNFLARPIRSCVVQIKQETHQEMRSPTWIFTTSSWTTFTQCAPEAGGPAPLPQKGHAPIFGPCLLWPNGRPYQILLSSYRRVYTPASGRGMPWPTGRTHRRWATRCGEVGVSLLATTTMTYQRQLAVIRTSNFYLYRVKLKGFRYVRPFLCLLWPRSSISATTKLL